jgi:hypothetical protein
VPYGTPLSSRRFSALAACAFAAVLLAVVRSGAVKTALTDLIASALSIAS